MKIEAKQVGELMTNCYIVWDENTMNAAVVDPGDDGAYLADCLKKKGLTLKYILLTHGHFDHITGTPELMECAGTNPKVYISEVDMGLPSVFSENIQLDPKAVTFWKEGDEITMDSITFKVISTPGHTPGSVCLIADDVIFSGDTLFQGSCGRTDFPGGSWAEMAKSLKRLYNLEGDYHVLSGHTNSTTLSRERKTNMFMLSALR